MSGKGEVDFIGIVESEGETEAKLRIFPEFCDGLRGINEFSQVIILYWIHLR
jgi:tRNA (Thr-GGU) A37 N-methylase